MRQEQYIQTTMFERESVDIQQPVRRLVEPKPNEIKEPKPLYDFSQIDFSQPQICQSLSRAYAVLLSRRLDGKTQSND